MKKFTFLKTVLTAVCMLVGVNAWADAGDVTTNADIDFSNAIVGTKPYTITGTVGSMTWNSQWTYAPTIVDGILRFGNFDGGTVELQNNTIGSKDVVTISFEMAFGKLSGKHVGFKFVDTAGNEILTQWFDAYNGDFDDNNPLGLNWGEMYRGSNTVIQDRCVYFTITIDYAANTIKTATGCYLSGTSKPITNGTHTVSLPSTTPIGKFVLMGNINNADRYSTFDNLLIQTTEGDYVTAQAGYTINWKCGGETLKTDDSRSGDVGTAIVLLASDKEAFEIAGKRYIYVSDDAGEKTIEGDGTTVVNLTFREAEKWNYNITSSFGGAALAFTKSGSVWEDLNTVNFQVPRFQESTGILVEAPYGANGDLSKSITVTSDDFASDIEYSATGITDLYLLSEAEDLGTGIATSGTSFTGRVSNGQIIFASSGTLITLPAGKYIFTLGVIGGGGGHNVEYIVKAGEIPVANGTCSGNVLQLYTGDEFTLTKSTDITFTCSDPSSQRGIDLIYIQKTGDATEMFATITSAGWATLYTNYALDFSGSSVTAYTATYSSSESTVTLNPVSDVPANTGVVLKGAEGSYAIPVIASSETEKGDLKGSATEALTFDEGAEYDYYMLAMNKESEAQFTKLTSGTIAAGKAYLQLPKSAGARTLNVVIAGGETTGISDALRLNDNGEMKNDNFFNLNGQRVEKPTKGLYIKNGKKVIIK